MITFVFQCLIGIFPEALISQDRNLTDKGVTFELLLRSDLFSNSEGAFRSVYQADFGLSLDGEILLGLDGLTFHLTGFANDGGQGAVFRETIQGLSNIESYRTVKLFQAYLLQMLLEERMQIIIGLKDLNTDFYVTSASSYFVNPSHGIGAEFSQSGANGPSIYPNSAFGIVIRGSMFENVWLRLGVFEATPGTKSNPEAVHNDFQFADGALIVAETSLEKNDDQIPFSLKACVGGWTFTKKENRLRVPELNTGLDGIARNGGIYFLGQGTLWQEENSKRGLGAYARIGLADRQMNLLAAQVGAGLLYRGMINGREGDIIGISIAQAYVGKDYNILVRSQGATTRSAEAITELLYRAPITEWFTLQGTLIHMHQPFGIKSTSDWVSGVRLILEW